MAEAGLWVQASFFVDCSVIQLLILSSIDGFKLICFSLCVVGDDIDIEVVTSTDARSLPSVDIVSCFRPIDKLADVGRVSKNDGSRFNLTGLEVISASLL